MRIFDYLPFVTIIMPIRNEINFIARSLSAVLEQNYPCKSMEILVVDGLSTDGTRDVVIYLANNAPRYPIQLIDNPGKIVSTGINVALRCAKGEIIIRVDGHCLIAPDYASKCVSYLQSGHTRGVGGPMKTVGQLPSAETIAVAMSSPFGVGNSAFRTTAGKTFFTDTIPFPAYVREVVNQIGYYDEELVRNQDDEYNYRLRENGGKLLLAADVVSTYYSRGTLRKLWNQYFQYGYWKIRVLQKHPRQMSLRQFVPFSFVLALLLSLVLTFLHPLGWLGLLLVAGSYLLANLSVSLFTAWHVGWQHLPLLPVTFAILHLSYGLGFMTGLAAFANRWGDKIGKTPSL